jgi:hypothetical protein
LIGAVYFERFETGHDRTADRSQATDLGLYLDPVLDLLKSHVLAHYAEHRLTSSQACLLQRLNHPMPQREAALQLGYDPSNITAG